MKGSDRSAPAPSADQSDERRATHWQVRQRRLPLAGRPLLMGILNVTPDSFSDGGRFSDVAAAVDHAAHLVAVGADILDIGGESTRPYSDPVGAQEELDRVMPVLERLAPRLDVAFSIDTSKALVARAAIGAGASIINDVTGLQGDAEMIATACDTGAGVCVMHMQGTPQTMQDDPTYHDVVQDVFEFLQARRDELVSAGIDQGRIALDPGIGFGKGREHNLSLLRNCYRLHELGCPLLVGHSRKGFIGKVTGDESAEGAIAGTIGVAIALANQGVQILRVHDVAAVRQALLLYEATRRQLPTANRRK